MDAKTAEWIVGQGIGAVLALVMFLVYRKDVHNALNSWRDQTKILTQLVQEVTAAIQGQSDAVRTHTDAVQAMERALPHACPMAERMANEAVADAAVAAMRRVR
jgi:membrane protein required for beta-lactamase induction